MNRLNWQSSIVFTATVLLISAMATTSAISEPLRPSPSPEDKVYNVEIGNSPSLGPSDAPVVIVEFSDFQ